MRLHCALKNSKINDDDDANDNDGYIWTVPRRITLRRCGVVGSNRNLVLEHFEDLWPLVGFYRCVARLRGPQAKKRPIDLVVVVVHRVTLRPFMSHNTPVARKKTTTHRGL